MGQYFYLVNKTKKEYLDPHCCNDGLKLWEIAANGNTMKVLTLLLRQSSETGGSDVYRPEDEKRLMKNTKYSAQQIRDYYGEPVKQDLIGHWAGDSITLVGDYDESGLFELANKQYKNISPWAVNEYNKFIENKELEIEPVRDYHYEYCEACTAFQRGVIKA